MPDKKWEMLLKVFQWIEIVLNIALKIKATFELLLSSKVAIEFIIHLFF